MATNAIAAGGTLLQVKYIESGTGASSGFDTIAEVVDITGPSLSADTSDVTNQDSFSTGAGGESGWEEHIKTVLRSGEITFDINYLPGNATQNTTSGNTNVGSGAAPGLLYIMENKSKETFKLIFPDATTGTSWELDGYVTGFEPSAPHDAKLDASVTIKPTGEPTLN